MTQTVCFESGGKSEDNGQGSPGRGQRFREKELIFTGCPVVVYQALCSGKRGALRTLLNVRVQRVPETSIRKALRQRESRVHLHWDEEG